MRFKYDICTKSFAEIQSIFFDIFQLIYPICQSSVVKLVLKFDNRIIISKLQITGLSCTRKAYMYCFLIQNYHCCINKENLWHAICVFQEVTLKKKHIYFFTTITITSMVYNMCKKYLTDFEVYQVIQTLKCIICIQQ